MMELSDAEVDRLLERFDQTEPKLQRQIVARFVCLAEQYKTERDALAKFKRWVHDYLDSQGVPHHPPGSHGAAGCRIGDRMDWLMGKLRKAEAIPFRDDDDVPVAWGELYGLGFRDPVYVGKGCREIHHPRGTVMVRIYDSSDGLTWYFNHRDVPAPQTRGDARRLLAALGLAL